MPVAAKPLLRDPIYDGAADPVVLWNPLLKKWWMFYTNRRASETALPGVSWVHGTRIGIAESSDGGANFTYAGTAQIDYGPQEYTHWAPEIIQHNGIWHMYLSIVPGIYNDWNAARDIIHLTSSNLRKWKFESKLNLDSDRVIDANVIRLPDGSWRMWYKNERAKNGSLYYADSSDLYHWIAKGNAIPGVAGEGAKIFRWRNVYWMMVDVWNGLAVFRSQDCLDWKRQRDNILKEPGMIATDRSKGGHADVVVNGDDAYLFYFVHQDNQDAAGQHPEYKRRSVIQVAELKLANGVITCDRNQPVAMKLLTPAN